MPKLTVNGKEVEVPAGTNLIEAARSAGVEVPHYCYHPGLSIAGQCRLCMVDIEKTPRPTIACNTVAADGMVVLTETDRVRETRKSIMEFHLINHPLDCPVCDQAGECWLQIYYMQHGLYDPRMTDEKVHKPKAVPLEVHVNGRRPHHADGRRVARLKPRFNADVNRWWLCDAGRYGFGFVDDTDRLLVPGHREGETVSDATWDEAIAAVTATLRRVPPEAIGVIASPKMANEDLFALRRLLDVCAIRRVAGQVPPRVPGDQDNLLIRADKNPNALGAELLGLGDDARAVLDAARGRQIRCLWIFGHDLLDSAWPEAEVLEALRAVETVIFTGTNVNQTSVRAHWVLPAAAWVERDGTYTNFQGRVQRFRQAVEPLGLALAEWELLGRVLAALGEAPSATRAEHWFRRLAAALPAVLGVSYQALAGTGRLVTGSVAARAPR